MERDLSELLREWAYEPGQINVRLIDGQDGTPKIQVRLDLGMIQMNIMGRPDGTRPHGFESLLEYYEQRLDDAEAVAGGLDEEDDLTAGAGADPEDEARAAGEPGVESAAEEAGDEPADGAGAAEAGTENEPVDPDGEPRDAEAGAEDGDDDDTPPGSAALSLDPEACRELREEAAQYYHRYVALLVLEDYEGVVRDTTRNLRVIDLCARYGRTPEDRGALQAVRPYVTMMRARALASQALRDNEPKAAIHAIDQGLEALKSHFETTHALDQYEQAGEVQLLRSMRDALVPKLPVSQKAELRQRLREAIERENYELAAILRDELRMLPG